MDQFLDFVADIMDVDVSEITMETKYKEFPRWDSLMMMNLIMEIEEEYGVQIPIEEVENIKSLNDLYSMIQI